TGHFPFGDPCVQPETYASSIPDGEGSVLAANGYAEFTLNNTNSELRYVIGPDEQDTEAYMKVSCSSITGSPNVRLGLRASGSVSSGIFQSPTGHYMSLRW